MQVLFKMCLVQVLVLVKSSFSGAVNHAQTCNFSPFIFVYHYNEFTVYFTDEVCKNDAHACATSGRPPSFREACVGGYRAIGE